MVTVIGTPDWHRLLDVQGVGREEEGEGEDWVWGVAYRIDPEQVEEVKAYLGMWVLLVTVVAGELISDRVPGESKLTSGSGYRLMPLERVYTA